VAELFPRTSLRQRRTVALAAESTEGELWQGLENRIVKSTRMHGLKACWPAAAPASCAEGHDPLNKTEAAIKPSMLASAFPFRSRILPILMS
jgi:hypothetical protein